MCRTGSQRTICRWFQGELPVDRSIFKPPMYKTLLALWDLLLDTCRNISSIITKFVFCFWKQTRNASEHLQDLSCAWVQDSDSSVFGRDRQPAAISVEADRQQQRVRRVAVVDGHQNHSDRVPEHCACLGHIPEEDLKRDNVRAFLLGEFIWT